MLGLRFGLKNVLILLFDFVTCASCGVNCSFHSIFSVYGISLDNKTQAFFKPKLDLSFCLLNWVPARLGDHAHRVHEGHDVGVDVPVVEREVVPAVEVDRVQAVHQHAARG